MVSSSRPWRPWVGLLILFGLLVGSNPVARISKGEPVPPTIDEERLPAGRILVEISEEGIPEEIEWPTTDPDVTESYTVDAFGLFRVPHAYIDTGIRADRANPFLLRAVARVELPAGRHRLLLRGRGATRLFIDGRNSSPHRSRPRSPTATRRSAPTTWTSAPISASPRPGTGSRG